MCKANGKRWNNYFETDRASAYVETLSSVTGIPVTGTPGLVQTRQGGTDQGTWVHPQVAVDLARWISPEFAVWMDGWFLEELSGGKVRQVQEPRPALKPAETLDLIERSYNLLERFGVVDERDQLQFGDMVRNVATQAAGGLLLPASDEMTITDAWFELTGERLARGKYAALGRLVAARYREEFKKEPPTRKQYVDGAPRPVKSYQRSWLLGAVGWIRDQMK